MIKFQVAPYIYVTEYKDTSFANWQIIIKDPEGRRADRSPSQVFNSYADALLYVAGMLKGVEVNNLRHWYYQQSLLLNNPEMKSNNFNNQLREELPFIQRDLGLRSV